MALATDQDLAEIRGYLLGAGDHLREIFDGLVATQKGLTDYSKGISLPPEPLVDNGVGRGPRPLTDLLEMMWEFAQPNQAKVLRAAISFVHTYSIPHNGTKKV